MNTLDILSRMKVLAVEISDFDSMFEPRQIEDMKNEYMDLFYLLETRGEGILIAIKNIEEEVAAHRARADVWRREVEVSEHKAASLENTIKWLKNTLLVGIIDERGMEDDKGKYMIIDGRKARIAKRDVIELKPEFDFLTLPQRFIRVKKELNKIEVNKAFKEMEDGVGSGEDWADALRSGFDIFETKTVRLY